MTSEYNQSDPSTVTPYPPQDPPAHEPGGDPLPGQVVDPADRPGYGTDPAADPGILDDPRGDFAGGPTAGGAAAGGAGGMDAPLPEPGAGPVATEGTSYPAGESGGPLTGSETLDDPHGRPGVPGDRGEDPGVVVDPADQYDHDVAAGQPAAPMEPDAEHSTPRAVGNPGPSEPGDEYNQPRAVGNPGTSDPADEYNQPRAVGNPGPDETDEYDQPRSIGNPGPQE